MAIRIRSLVAIFLYVTTSKKKTGFLLIEVFRKLINPQIEGHQEMIQVAIYYLSAYLRFISGSLFVTPPNKE